MYKWYRNAGVCYAFLQDVPGCGQKEEPESDREKYCRVHEFDRDRLESSEWFVRGWSESFA